MSVWNERLGSMYSPLPAGLRHAVRSLVIDGPLPERMRRALGRTILQSLDRSPNAMIFDNWLGVFSRRCSVRSLGRRCVRP